MLSGQKTRQVKYRRFFPGLPDQIACGVRIGGDENVEM
jgi:hypothetical protein